MLYVLKKTLTFFHFTYNLQFIILKCEIVNIKSVLLHKAHGKTKVIVAKRTVVCIVWEKAVHFCILETLKNILF